MDASATELYTALCTDFNQNPSLKYLQDKQLWCKKVNTYLGNHLFVVPVAFGSQTHGGRDMLNHTQRIIQETEDDGTALDLTNSHFGLYLMLPTGNSKNVQEIMHKKLGIRPFGKDKEEEDKEEAIAK